MVAARIIFKLIFCCFFLIAGGITLISPLTKGMRFEHQHFLALVMIAARIVFTLQFGSCVPAISSKPYECRVLFRAEVIAQCKKTIDFFFLLDNIL